MTDLELLFAPRSIAVVGASADPDALSGRPLEQLARLGYPGTIYPVNPNRKKIAGLTSYPSIGDVPEQIDLALIVVPGKHVMDVLRQCAEQSVSFAVIMSSGFAEQDFEGQLVEDEMRDLVKFSGMRILGPNGEGYFNASGAVAATFSPAVAALTGTTPPSSNGVAVVSQSGGLGFALLDRGRASGIEFTYVVSTGNEVDLDMADVGEFLLGDPATKVILFLGEGVRDPGKFSAFADRAQKQGTAIAFLKLGRSDCGAEAALAHTAHDAGNDDGYSAAFRRFGVHTANDDQELLDLAMLFSRIEAQPVRKVAILTTSGGAGVLLADRLDAEGFAVPALSPALQLQLRNLMPAFGSARNPVDLTAQAIATGGIPQALELLWASSEVDAVILIASLVNPRLLEHEGDLIARSAGRARKPFLLYTYTGPSPRSIELLEEHQIPWCPSAFRTARVLGALRSASAAKGDSTESDALKRSTFTSVENPSFVVQHLLSKKLPLGSHVVGQAQARTSPEIRIKVHARVDKEFGAMVSVSSGMTKSSALAPVSGDGARDLLFSVGAELRVAVQSKAGPALCDLVEAASNLFMDPLVSANEVILDPISINAAEGTISILDMKVGTTELVSTKDGKGEVAQETVKQ